MIKIVSFQGKIELLVEQEEENFRFIIIYFS